MCTYMCSNSKRVAGGKLHSASCAGSRLRGCGTHVRAGEWRAAGSADSRQRPSGSTCEQQRMQDSSVFECECMCSVSNTSNMCNCDANAALLIVCVAELIRTGPSRRGTSIESCVAHARVVLATELCSASTARHRSPALCPRLRLSLQLGCPFGDLSLRNASKTPPRHSL